MDTFYFGARPKISLTQLLDKAELRIIHAHYKKGILASVSTCRAVVLHWKSKRDQRVIEEANAAGIPVVVITANLAAAVEAGEPQADLYLEEPASSEEVASLLLDLITTKQNAHAAVATGEFAT
jgi:hypothetical protein